MYGEFDTNSLKNLYGEINQSDLKDIVVKFSETIDSVTKNMPEEVETIILTSMGAAIGVKFSNIVLMFGSLYLIGKLFNANNRNVSQKGYVIRKNTGTEV